MASNTIPEQQTKASGSQAVEPTENRLSVLQISKPNKLESNTSREAPKSVNQSTSTPITADILVDKNSNYHQRGSAEVLHDRFPIKHIILLEDNNFDLSYDIPKQLVPQENNVQLPHLNGTTSLEGNDDQEKNNSEPGSVKDTPLHHATRGEHLDVVKLLLSAGASPNRININIYGKIPTQLADLGTEARSLLEVSANSDSTAFQMFTSSCRRLRIMKGSDAIGLECSPAHVGD